MFAGRCASLAKAVTSHGENHRENTEPREQLPTGAAVSSLHPLRAD